MRDNLNLGNIDAFRNSSRGYSDASIFMHEAIARKAGLSGADHKYLGLLVQEKELTAGDLSKLTGLTTGAVTGLIDRLEKKKLVKRVFTKEDRRKVIIVPHLDNIQHLLAPLFTELSEQTTILINSFSNSEIEIIKRYFDEATAIMKAVTDDLNHQQIK